MFDVTSYLPIKKKLTPSGWLSFNAPCCIHRGESSDKRKRGGIKTHDEGWSYSCFNCGYTASHTMGRNLSFKARRLLEWLGVDRETIEHINLESMRHRSIHGLIQDQSKLIKKPRVEFEERDLPAHLELITEHHVQHYEYLKSRKVSLDFPFMIDPQASRPGILIPFTYNNTVVGHTTRFLDDRKPKYLSDLQPGYVFGTGLQKPNWQMVIVMEGVFDALSINGLGLLHNDINDAQAQVIRDLEREPIVVPDQDRAGLNLIDRAMSLGWAVSIPNWPDGIKDVNEAVIRFGKLGTLLTILEARETSRIKIEIRKKKLAKRLRAS
jgi:hypothetical protein